MDARRVIAAIRDGQRPGAEALGWFARGLASGAVSEAQGAAFAMAVLLRGLHEDDRVTLTRAMRDSGRVLAWDLPGPVADKHSTGGLGDCVSLLLAPALAVCGVYVPMISGRGLGHTGGTLDKLEAIPGYRCDLPVEELRRIVAQVGCAIVGASADIAPADRKLYAIRDVTATVESLDLITASILSKKLAAGLEALVLDVKAGSGAFMKTQAQAEALARSLVGTAKGAGCASRALITGMAEPLAPAMGNALELRVVMQVLTGAGPADTLWHVTRALAAEVLCLTGIAADLAAACAQLDQALHSGAAAERFGRMVAAQGGPADFVERWQAYLPQAPLRRAVLADRPAFVQAMAGEALGLAVVDLGAGRQRLGDRVDPSVGLSDIAPIGAPVGPGGAALAVIHAADTAAADRAEAALRAAIRLGDAPGASPELLLGRVE